MNKCLFCCINQQRIIIHSYSHIQLYLFVTLFPAGRFWFLSFNLTSAPWPHCVMVSKVKLTSNLHLDITAWLTLDRLVKGADLPVLTSWLANNNNTRVSVRRLFRSYVRSLDLISFSPGQNIRFRQSRCFLDSWLFGGFQHKIQNLPWIHLKGKEGGNVFFMAHFQDRQVHSTPLNSVSCHWMFAHRPLPCGRAVVMRRRPDSDLSPSPLQLRCVRSLPLLSQWMETSHCEIWM